MTRDVTGRFNLPMLVPGQAQKEMTHNEALALIDMALHPQVVAVGMNAPPADPMVGECWIVGDSPVDAWEGHAATLAGWTAGGWRFLSGRPGMTVSVANGSTTATFSGGEWRNTATSPAVAVPAGGDVIDLQARSAIEMILDIMRQRGWIEPIGALNV